jgi:hypothetical protein
MHWDRGVTRLDITEFDPAPRVGGIASFGLRLENASGVPLPASRLVLRWWSRVGSESLLIE